MMTCRPNQNSRQICCCSVTMLWLSEIDPDMLCPSGQFFRHFSQSLFLKSDETIPQNPKFINISELRGIVSKPKKYYIFPQDTLKKTNLI